MQKDTLKIVLTVFLIACLILVIVGAIGAGLGHTAYFVSLIFGLGLMLRKVTTKKVTLRKSKESNNCIIMYN
jgi:CTP-dependent riboflavin kinase